MSHPYDRWLQSDHDYEKFYHLNEDDEGDENMNRTEHLEWCKKRAIEYVDSGDIGQAYASFMSDMTKHTETRDHAALTLGMELMISGQLNTNNSMRKFINGFN